MELYFFLTFQLSTNPLNQWLNLESDERVVLTTKISIYSLAWPPLHFCLIYNIGPAGPSPGYTNNIYSSQSLNFTFQTPFSGHPPWWNWPGHNKDCVALCEPRDCHAGNRNAHDQPLNLPHIVCLTAGSEGKGKLNKMISNLCSG